MRNASSPPIVCVLTKRARAYLTAESAVGPIPYWSVIDLSASYLVPTKGEEERKGEGWRRKKRRIKKKWQQTMRSGHNRRPACCGNLIYWLMMSSLLRTKRLFTEGNIRRPAIPFGTQTTGDMSMGKNRSSYSSWTADDSPALVDGEDVKSKQLEPCLISPNETRISC